MAEILFLFGLHQHPLLATECTLLHLEWLIFLDLLAARSMQLLSAEQCTYSLDGTQLSLNLDAEHHGIELASHGAYLDRPASIHISSPMYDAVN
jgi:hypothetical protein